MADVTLKNNENVTVGVSALDSRGAVIATPFDAGSVFAVFADGAAFQVAVSADEATLNVMALGPIISGDVLTVTGSIASVPLTAATLTFDVVAGPPVAISLTPQAPAVN